MKSNRLVLIVDLEEALGDGPIESYSENWKDFDSFSIRHLVHVAEPTKPISGVLKDKQNFH